MKREAMKGCRVLLKADVAFDELTGGSAEQIFLNV
jgi:hypothetical protein